VLRLHKAGKAADRGTLYAIGRIVLVAPAGGTLAVDSDLRGLRTALDQGRIRRFAIANPEHAPYGERAREALTHAGLWQRLQPTLVYGENVAQALQFVTLNAAEGGIVALSLVKTPGFAATGRAALIPESWHTPLRQRMVLMPGAGAEARRFHAWLQTAPARRIFVRYGFTLPGEPG
jgi:molybdate transport system substrate-binding protein